MPHHLIAVETYGTQRVTSPAGGKVSAQKLGYTTCGRDVLLALYGSDAVDVTSKRASYHYVQITGEMAVHSDTLLLALSDDELATVEGITRKHPSERSGCWRWLDNPGRTDNGWHRFPTAAQSDYQPSKYNEGPRYNPTGYRAVSPSGMTSSAVPTIRAERTQRSASDTPWWWITGDTYPHRAAFKAAGCRWSRKRKSWYFVGETLPKSVQEIIDTATFDAEEEAAQPEPEQPVGTGAGGKFKVGDRVQATDDFMALGGGTIKGGTPGTVTKCFGSAGELGWSYTIRFENFGETWCFEMDLDTSLDTTTPSATESQTTVITSTAEESSVEPITQAVPLQNNISDTPPTPVPTITSDNNPVADEDEAEPAIRVLKPEVLPEHLQTAVEAARGKSVTVSAPRSNGTRTPIGQAYVGELTGAITGNVLCYGYAVHQSVLLYLNMGGPSTAVAAIRARLAKGEVVNLVPWDGPTVELSAGETDGAANTGMFTAFVHNISEAKFTSTILMHEWLTDPNYGGASVTGIFRTHDAQAIAKLTDHVRKLVKVPVFECWGGFLFSAGESAGLVRSPRGGGGVDLLVVDLDADAWTRLITGGLANGVIALPTSSSIT